MDLQSLINGRIGIGIALIIGSVIPRRIGYKLAELMREKWGIKAVGITGKDGAKKQAQIKEEMTNGEEDRNPDGEISLDTLEGYRPEADSPTEL